MMVQNVQLDHTDREILKALMQDARQSFAELAKKLNVSTGTVHVRYNKLKEEGVITGSKIMIDANKLGHDVTAFIGVNLVSAKDYQKVLLALKEIPEIVEAHYTTGQYSMFIKVMAKDTRQLHLFLIEKLQSIKEIASTETLLALDSPIDRDVPLT